MPVWHNASRKWREDGDLFVVGITQEQHPDRCRLFAQWQGIDWPILWDPFNVTGSKVVPHFVLIDEHGIVRNTRARTDTIEAEFLEKSFAVADAPPGKPSEARHIVQCDTDPDDPRWRAVSWLLWGHEGKMDAAIDALARGAGDDADWIFRLGVAERMRYDSKARRRGDFQHALDHWSEALSKRKDQYIWRRRIQQYGPRPDKPYPFYDWVSKAEAAVRERGDTPVALRAPLTTAERAGKGEIEAASSEEPDPEGKIPTGTGVDVESAIARSTSDDAAMVHLRFHEVPGSGVAFEPDAGAPEVWFLGRRRTPESYDDRGYRFEVEVTLEARARSHSGYVLYHACLEDGTCRYLRHPFDIDLPAADDSE